MSRNCAREQALGIPLSRRLLGRLGMPTAYQRMCWVWIEANKEGIYTWESKDAEMFMNKAFT